MSALPYLSRGLELGGPPYQEPYMRLCCFWICRFVVGGIVSDVLQDRGAQRYSVISQQTLVFSISAVRIPDLESYQTVAINEIPKQ
jgi:hypothetical protein